MTNDLRIIYIFNLDGISLGASGIYHVHSSLALAIDLTDTDHKKSRFDWVNKEIWLFIIFFGLQD